MRKWRKIHSLHFLPLYPFSLSKIVSVCRKMLNTAILSRMLQKTGHTRYEKIVLGRVRCEKGPQVVPAWFIRGRLGPICGMFSSFRALVKRDGTG